MLILSRYADSGASSRVRIFQYIPAIVAGRTRCIVKALFDNNYLEHYYWRGRRSLIGVARSYVSRIATLACRSKHDIIWIEKELLPFLPFWMERVLLPRGVPYAVDIDDAIFHYYDLTSNKFVRRLLGGKIDKLMHGAALVTAGSEYLAERARKAGATKVEIIPSVVDLERYQVAKKKDAGLVTIGWIGSPTTAQYVQDIEQSLCDACAQGRAQVVLVGAGSVGLRSYPFKSRLWNMETEVSDIQSFDIGIMPLPDNPWERGKCGFKLIQYMACGIPVVASPVGVNKEIVEHGVNGFLAETKDEWTRALATLRDNPKMRRAMGRAGRAKVEQKYCLQVTAPRLMELLKEAAGK